MADISKSVSISYNAKTEDLEKALRKIPAITEKNGKKSAQAIDRSFKKMEKSANKAAKKVGRDTKKMKQGFANLAGAMAAVGAGSFLLIKKIADLTNELVDASAKTGIAVDTLAGLRLAAEGSGQEFSALESGLIKFQGSMDSAANGSKAMASIFHDLEVEVSDTNGALRNSDDVFNEVIVSLGKMENETERNAATMKLFGRTAGPGLIQSGALTNLQNMKRFSQEFGVSLQKDAIKGTADLQVAIAEFSTVAFGVFNNLILAIAGPNGSTAMVKGLSSAFIFVGHVAGDIIGAIGQHFENIFGFVQAGILVMSGDFGLAAELIKQLAGESKTAVVNLTNTFSNASAAVENFNNLSGTSPAPKQFTAAADAATETAEGVDSATKSVKTLKEEIEDLSSLFEDISGSINEDLVTPTDEANKRFEETKNKIEEVTQKLKEQMALIPESGGSTEDQEKRIELVKLEGELTQAIIDNELRLKRDLQEIENEAWAEKQDALQDEASMKEELHQKELARLEELRAQQLELVGSTHETFQSVMGAFTAEYDAIVEYTTRVRDEQISAVEKLEKEGIISAESAAKRKLKIEEKYQGGINEYKMKSYNADKVASVADVIFNTAMAVTKAFADYGATPAGIAAAVLSGAQGAAQLAAIQSAPVPQFDIGGMIGNRDPRQPDQISARLLSGEAVLDRTTVRNLGGENGVRQLQNGHRSNEVIVIQPFKHLDRYNKALAKRNPTRSGSRGY